MKTSHAIGRREFVHRLTAAAAVWPLVKTPARAAGGGAPIDIGSRRELFVDDFLIATAAGVGLRLHKPVAREVSLVCDRPWEGNTSAYYAIFQDGGRFRAYYRGSHVDETTKKRSHPEFTCYAESGDGIKWVKPDLGLIEFNGSKNNNIVWAGAGTHNFTVFKDDSPGCDSAARYKALAGGTIAANGKKKGCLNAFKSADGIRWTPMAEAVITEGAFDSQNLAFWDGIRNEYRAYWRIFSAAGPVVPGVKTEKYRAIRTATSKDFITWNPHDDLRYVNSPPEHLYTNAVMPYFRARHLFIGFPTRFQPKTQQVEPVFMSSRDGVLFKRWDEALIPITAPEDRDGNRSNYMTWGLLQLPGNDGELSIYATEAYYAGPGSRVRRFSLRTDGFVSAHADADGDLVTRPLIFAGSRLSLNVACRGGARVELQDVGGKPLPGFALGDCTPITGDLVEHPVAWRSGAEVRTLAGRPIRVRFALQDADLYSMQFAS